MATPRVIGIDLGTSNTVAAYADGRIPRVIPTERGHNLLPSVVAYPPVSPTRSPSGSNLRPARTQSGGFVMPERTKSGGFLRPQPQAVAIIGHPAKEQLLVHPQETVYGSKRFVGRPFASQHVQALRPHFAYELVEGAEGLCAANVGGAVRPLIEISAIILEQIKRYAQAHLGGELDGAVITVPANYPLKQRDAVKQAAALAGIDVWRLVNEPTAASLAYGVGRHLEQKVLILDLGGGTFDVSVLDIADGTYQVLASIGDGFLGGIDFDIRLTDHIISRFMKEGGADIKEDPTAVQRVLNAAEAAKCDLSMLRHTEIRLPFIATKRGKPVDLMMPLSREELTKMTSDLIDRCITYIDAALAEAGLQPNELDEVLLVGGQTRMPALQERVAKHLGRPGKKGLHPDEVVAQGAALLARSLSLGDVRLLDVLSVPVGHARRQTGDEAQRMPAYEVILDRNVTLPHENVVEIATWADDQTAVPLEVFQGAGPALDDAEYVGTARVTGIPSSVAGRHKVRFKLALDVEGLLSVSAQINNGPEQPAPLTHRPPSYVSHLSSQEGRVVDDQDRQLGLLSRWFRK